MQRKHAVVPLVGDNKGHIADYLKDKEHRADGKLHCASLLSAELAVYEHTQYPYNHRDRKPSKVSGIEKLKGEIIFAVGGLEGFL